MKAHALSYGSIDSAQDLRCERLQAWPTESADTEDVVQLTLLECGSITLLHNGMPSKLEVGKLNLFWAAIPHQVIEFSGGAVLYVVTIPLCYIMQWSLPADFVNKVLHGNLVFDKHKVDGIDLERFKQWELDLSRESSQYVKPVLLEIQARLIRFAKSAQLMVSSCDRVGDEPFQKRGFSKANQIISFVAQNYTKKITAQIIGEAVNLNPNYAMNLFQKMFGTTLNSYITQRRVSHAQHLLRMTNEKITDIATMSGFSSISRFNEAFVTSCGCSPSEYRKSLRLEECFV